MLALAAAAAAPAGAQPTGGAAQPGGNPTDPSRSDAQVGFERRQHLSPQEQLFEGDKIISRMEQSSSTVRRQLEQARAQRDVVKTLCLNDKLSQVDVAIRSARDRKSALQAAVNRNDSELSTHEFTILTVLRQRTEQLDAEANQCIGEEAAFIGETRVVTTIDPTIPTSDETQYPPTDPTLISGPPTCTTCSL